MPHNVSLSLYKAYLLPHLEHCSPLLIAANKTLNSKLESANKYALKTLLNLGNNLKCDSILYLIDMQSLEHRRYYSSLLLLYKFMNSNGPQYIKNFFQTRYTKYKLRSRALIWNNLATITNSFIARFPIQLVPYRINCLYILEHQVSLVTALVT